MNGEEVWADCGWWRMCANVRLVCQDLAISMRHKLTYIRMEAVGSELYTYTYTFERVCVCACLERSEFLNVLCKGRSEEMVQSIMSISYERCGGSRKNVEMA